MNKPYIICHMMTSIDGKIDGAFFDEPASEKPGDLYETLKCQMADAWANGTNTLKMYFADADIDYSVYKGIEPVIGDHVPEGEELPWLVAFDAHGRLDWDSPKVEYPGGEWSRVLEVTTESVRPEFLAHLDKLGIARIVAGKDAIDFPLALEKLSALGIQRIALCGGAKINGALFDAGLIDEISLIIAPYVSGEAVQTIAECTSGKSHPFALKDVERLTDGALRLTFLKA